MRVTDPSRLSQISQSNGYHTWSVPRTGGTIDFVTLSATDVEKAIAAVKTVGLTHYQQFLPGLRGSEANTEALTKAFREATKELFEQGGSSAPAGDLTFGISSNLEGNKIKLYWTYGKDENTVVENLYNTIKDGKANKEIALTCATYNSEEEDRTGAERADNLTGPSCDHSQLGQDRLKHLWN